MQNNEAFENAMYECNTKEFERLLTFYDPPNHLPHSLVSNHLDEMAELWLKSLKNNKHSRQKINEFAFHAISYNQPTLVRMGFEYGANANYKKGRNLCFACSRADMDIIYYLLEKGAYVQTENEYGGTPLIFATVANRKDVITLLIKKGADINRISKNKKSVITQMIYYEKHEMINWYLKEYSHLLTATHRKELQKARIKLLF